MPVPFSKREKLLLAGLLFFAAFTTLLGAIDLNRASSHDAFLGDSITFMWQFPRVNLGIPGQTSTQILARFNGEIPGRAYRKVFILAGTNDTLLHVDPDITIVNIETMADLSLKANAEPILAEIPPITRDGGKYLPAVQLLNARIRQLAARRGFKVVDYYDAIINHPQGLVDGVHLRRGAYLRLELALIRTRNPF